MARKSKRAIATEKKSPRNIFNTAVYIRLSMEDRLYKHGSDSIANQRELILDYLKDKHDMRVYDIYCDNGRTGTDFDREEFRRMMYDVYNGKVNCIVVKDLSRFGREYIETGDYLERIFPLLGVRFIAVNDGYDNRVDPFDITVPIKNVINTLYARDISAKSAAALRMKQENGEFIGSFAPYGYIRSKEDRHKLVIDPEAADVVKKIFEWKAENVSYAEISRRLYAMSIPTPNRRKYDLGILKSEVHKNNVYWRPETVRSILANETYTGCLVQGHIKSHFYEGGKDERVDRDDLIIVRGTHEPIISENLFNTVRGKCEKVKQAYDDRAGKYRELGSDVNIFVKKAYCGDCGRPLSRYKKVNGDRVAYFYICKQHSQYPNSCSFVSIAETELKDIVSETLKKQLAYLVDMQKFLSQAGNDTSIKQKKHDIVKELGKAVSRIGQIRMARVRAASDHAKGILSESEYSEISAGLKAEMKEAAQCYEAADRARERLEKLLETESRLEKTAQLCAAGLSRSVIESFIDRVTVYPDKEAVIKWNFGDKAELLASLNGGGTE